MERTHALTFVTSGDRDVILSRVFDVPADVLFHALTTPHLVQQWLGVHHPWSMPVCDIDLREGGAYRYQWQHPNGKSFGSRGTYLHVTPNARIEADEYFMEYPTPVMVTQVLTEAHGRTTLSITERYASEEIRGMALASGMETGVESSYDTLAVMLATAAVT